MNITVSGLKKKLSKVKTFFHLCSHLNPCEESMNSDPKFCHKERTNKNISFDSTDLPFPVSCEHSVGSLFHCYTVFQIIVPLHIRLCNIIFCS